MNFLAHIYLSGQHEKVMLGNFIGDFVKGKEIDKLNAPFKLGVSLHRAIDQFTDEHSVVLESKKRVRSVCGHYAPVVVDMYYDHFLAANWSRFSSTELKSFTSTFYDITDKYWSELPQKCQHMLVYMKRDDWLYQYQFIEGIDKAFNGMSRRANFESNMEKAAHLLTAHYGAFEDEFNTFFPDLVLMCKQYLMDKNA
ncbi:MAG: acyl carrier protein phosphodiesterase [Cyclobacteriaceae bacterium]